MSNATQLISQTGATQLVPPINAIVLKSGLTPVGGGGGAVTSVAGRTGAVTLTSADLTDTTPAGRALLDDADAAAQRTTLGLGSAATADAGDFATPAQIATKLDDLASGTADAIVTASSDGTLLSRAAYTIATLLAAARDRATHTGTQLASTISDFASAALSAVTWSTLTGKPSTFTPSTHASSHASGGGDALTGLATSQMPDVSPGSEVSGTTHTVTDSDAGLSRECTGASCQLSFGDAISLDSSGQFRRMSQGGAITWTATGSVAIQVASGLVGATASGDAPAYVNWHCVDDDGTKVIVLSGDLV